METLHYIGAYSVSDSYNVFDLECSELAYPKDTHTVLHITVQYLFDSQLAVENITISNVQGSIFLLF